MMTHLLTSRVKSITSLVHVGDVALAVTVGLLLGIIFSIGKSFYATLGLISFSDAWMWGRGVLYGCGCSVIVLCLITWWNYYCAHQHPPKNKRVIDTLISLRSRTQIIVLSIIISVIWIPAFLAFYPGNYSSDGPIQVTYFLNDGVVDLHWPAAHTLLLTGLIQLGNILFGTYNAGVSLFCAIQAIFLAFCLSFALSRMISWKIPVWVIAISFFITALNPVVQAYAVTTAKDTLFAGLFVLVTVLLVEALRQPSKWTEVPFVLGYIISAFGMCLMRKQGVYVLAVVIVITIFFIRKWRIRFIALLNLICVFLLSGLFSTAVTATFTVREDSARELLSVPSQQIVRTYMYDYDSLTEEQILQIGQYYDLDALEAGRTTAKPWDTTPIGMYYDTDTAQGYLAPISDPAKAALIDTAVTDDLLGYIRMYFSIMRGHEDEYIRAFLWGEIGYLYPTSAAVNRWTGLSPWNEFQRTIDAGGSDNQISNYNQTSLSPTYLRWLYDGTWNMFSGKPLLSLWVSPALPFLILLTSFVLIKKRKDNHILILTWLFPFLYWASLSLAPVMCIRYVVPLFFSLPILIGLPFCKLHNEI